MMSTKSLRVAGALAGVLALAACGDSSTSPTAASADRASRLPNWEELRTALEQARAEANGGFNLEMWATVVDRDGRVVAVAFTGGTRSDQWLGSRAISAQKANAANAFSLDNLSLATANLYSAVQPGGSLYGLQFSNPQDPDVIYAGPARDYGTRRDPMLGKRPGGINVFGGGLALYDKSGKVIGAIGVSGDASCADHNIAWKTRDFLKLDNVTAGVSPAPAFDNIVYDIVDGKSPSGWGHPVCSPAATAISNGLPTTNPIGGN